MDKSPRVSTRRRFMRALAAVAAFPRCMRQRYTPRQEGFVCPPCGCSMDGEVFVEPGVCPDCGMLLGPRDEVALGTMPTRLPTGGGSFEVQSHAGPVTIHYYRPPSFTAETPILLVVPGTGRNAVSYRNAWLVTARRHGVLVAALHYPRQTHDFAAYHMGGVIRELVLPNVAGQRVIRLRDEDIRFKINIQRDNWLFPDFDRVFDRLKRLTGSQRSGYDVFGHSAGGQILHRLALFYPSSRAERIVAANAGFYTLPNLDRRLPTGLAGTGLDVNALRQAFATRLTILLGEQDNSDTAGGVLLHTPAIDAQGLSRLARGTFFFRAGQAEAERLNAPFQWRKKFVPGVGHNFRAMSEAAADYLYNRVDSADEGL